MTTAHDEQWPPDGRVSRRQLVRGSAMAGTALAAGAALAACGASTPDSSGPPPTTTDAKTLPEFGRAPATTTGEAAPPATSAGQSQPATPGTEPPITLDSTLPALVVGKTSAIPVGGGVIFPKHGVVVTQPTAGKFECFSTSCTHQGCTLNKVAAGVIRCPCHGAKFSIVDGSVKAGPAPRPLTAQPFTIKEGQIVLS